MTSRWADMTHDVALSSLIPGCSARLVVSNPPPSPQDDPDPQTNARFSQRHNNPCGPALSCRDVEWVGWGVGGVGQGGSSTRIGRVRPPPPETRSQIFKVCLGWKLTRNCMDFVFGRGGGGGPARLALAIGHQSPSVYSQVSKGHPTLSSRLVSW